MATRSLHGHTLKTPGTALGYWLDALGFTSESPAYWCSSPSIKLSDFESAQHGYHPVGHHQATYLLREPVQVTDRDITSSIPVWTGEILGPSGHLRIVGTINPEGGKVVLFHQQIADSNKSLNPHGVTQTLHCH